MALVVVPALITMAAPMGAASPAVDAARSNISTVATNAAKLDATGCAADADQCLHVGETATLPLHALWLEGSCTMSFTVSWGDGSPPEVTVVTDGAVLVHHTYAAVGTYTVIVSTQVITGCPPGADYGYTATIQVIAPEELTANTGGPYKVRRAATVHLDATKSKGPIPITSYQWDFTPGTNCPDKLKLRNPTLTTSSPTTDIVVLCGLFVKLTVTDGAGTTASAKTLISVLRRGGTFKPTKVRLTDGAADDLRTPIGEIDAGTFIGARSVSGCRTTSINKVLCPPVEKFKQEAYDTATVDNPEGPFDEFEYVSRNGVTVPQEMLFNINLFPGSAYRYRDPKLPGKTITWRDMNLRKGAPVAELVESIRQHEGWGKGGSPTKPKDSGHAGATQLAMLSSPTKDDPALVLERLFDTTKIDLEAAARQKLQGLEFRLAKAAADPLPPVWSGKVWVWDHDQGRWKQRTLTTGGEGHVHGP